MLGYTWACVPLAAWTCSRRHRRTPHRGVSRGSRDGEDRWSALRRTSRRTTDAPRSVLWAGAQAYLRLSQGESRTGRPHRSPDSPRSMFIVIILLAVRQAGSSALVRRLRLLSQTDRCQPSVLAARIHGCRPATFHGKILPRSRTRPVRGRVRRPPRRKQSPPWLTLFEMTFPPSKRCGSLPNKVLVDRAGRGNGAKNFQA